MSSKKNDNRYLLISLTKEINKIYEEMKIIKEDVDYIKNEIKEQKAIVIDKDGEETEVETIGWRLW
tara:strand:- start:845 stop:1042 length:198 start_codon:yes stop_codon:yes gene_type:complete